MKTKINILTVSLGLCAIIWLVVIMGSYHNITQTHALSKDEISEVIMRDTIPEPIIKAIKGKPIKGVDVNEIIIPNDIILINGKELFTNMCASCHGSEGKGDGVGGESLIPKPRNFTMPNDWKNGTKISALYKTIEEGITGSGMNAYEFLTVKDKFAIIHYIRTFADHFQSDTPEELVLFNDTYELDSDRRAASQIPIEDALAKILAEAEGDMLKVESLKSKFENDTSVEAKLLSKIINNESGVFCIILRNTSWRQAPRSFLELASANVGSFGFNANVNRLRLEEIQMIYNYLLTML